MGQATQAAADAELAALVRPAPHDVGAAELAAHQKPAGQADVRPSAQKLPAGHAVHVAASTRYDSVAYTVPSEPTATPRIEVRRKPGPPAVASIVDTTPAAETRRSALFPQSAAKTVPAESAAMPWMQLNRADAAGPSAQPASQAPARSSSTEAPAEMACTV